MSRKNTNGGLLSREDASEVFRRLRDANPHPKTELEYTSPFTLLVAVVLSAQATDIGVNKATARLFPVADTAQKILALGEEGLRGYIKTIGLFNAKAKNVMALCRILVDRYDGEIPRTMEELQALPGVGRKTANVVMNVAFGHPTIAVDTHVFRVSNRLGLADGRTPDAVEQQLLKIIPAEYLPHAHHWLILHGRYICKAQRPLCEQCPLTDICRYYHHALLAQTLVKKPVPPPKSKTAREARAVAKSVKTKN